MFDAKKLLDQMIGTAEAYAGKENIDKVKGAISANPGMAKAAGVGLAAVLLGTKGGRKLTGNAARLGGLAVVGGLAYQAFQNWQSSQSATAPASPSRTERVPELAPPPANSPFAGNEQERAMTFLVAMISSAKADGHIDAEEQKRIYGQLNQQIEGAEAKAFLMDEMMAPLDMGKLARLATSHERAVEIYAASCMAIDLDHADERAYLDKLSEELKLEPALTEEIEKAVAQERAAV
jgi:uncharacterized membrane protein YebE (DUF533 family)